MGPSRVEVTGGRRGWGGRRAHPLRPFPSECSGLRERWAYPLRRFPSEGSGPCRAEGSGVLGGGRAGAPTRCGLSLQEGSGPCRAEGKAGLPPAAFPLRGIQALPGCGKEECWRGAGGPTRCGLSPQRGPGPAGLREGVSPLLREALRGGGRGKGREMKACGEGARWGVPGGACGRSRAPPPPPPPPAASGLFSAPRGWGGRSVPVGEAFISAVTALRPLPLAGWLSA